MLAKRKINRGMILIMTSVILFFAASIVAILTTLTISNMSINNNLNTQYQTKIILKNKSLDVYSRVKTNIDSLGASLIYNDDNSDTELKNKIEVHSIPEISSLSYEYSISSDDFVNAENLKDMTLKTTIFSTGNNVEITSMRFN